MPIYHNIKHLFIHIPKNAGSSVFVYMKQIDYKLKKANGNKHELMNVKKLVDNDEMKNILTLFGFIPSIPHSLQHLTYQEITRFYDPIKMNYKILAISRNPYDRLCSDYYFFLKIHKNILTFKTFVIDFLDPKNLEKYDHHPLPQVEYIKGCEDYVHMFRYETLDNDFEKYFSEKLKIKQTHNTTRNNKNSYMDMYDEELKRIVYEYYKDDFKYFNYDPML
jgi:hypothetical protein